MVTLVKLFYEGTTEKSAHISKLAAFREKCSGEMKHPQTGSKMNNEGCSVMYACTEKPANLECLNVASAMSAESQIPQQHKDFLQLLVNSLALLLYMTCKILYVILISNLTI